MLALDDLHHPAFGAAIGTPSLDARQDAVAVHRVAQIVATDKKIALHPRHGLIRDEETVSVAMRHDSSGNQIRIAERFDPGRNCARGCGGAADFDRGWPRDAERAALGDFFARASPGQPVAAAVAFLDLTILFELLHDSREIAASVLLSSIP